MSNFCELVGIWAIFGSSKNCKLLERKHIMYHFEASDSEIPNIICFPKHLNFTKIKAIMYFTKFLNAFVKLRNFNFSQNKLYIWDLQIICFKMIWTLRKIPFPTMKSMSYYSLSPGFWQRFISIEVCRDCIPALASSCKKQLTGFFVCLLFFLKVKRIS